MRKILIPLVILLLLPLSITVAQAQDLSGTWDVNLNGFNYFTDQTPAKVNIPDTGTTMEIQQNGSRVTITFGAFAGVHAATIFKGAIGKGNFVATWWYQGYPYETKVITGRYSEDGESIKGTMIYPRAADKAGIVPGWVEVEFIATRKAAIIIPKPLKPVIPQGAAILLGLKEDCVTLNPATTEVKNISGRWKIVDGSHWILDFGTNKQEAERSLKIIKHYGLDSFCFVGRPDPSMTYWLTGGQSPSGPVPGEDAIGFNPGTIQVQKIGDRWKIVDEPHWILDFSDNEEEARTAFQIIKKYGFSYICFVGRPNPSMTYFRK